jgi:hypothetical protein
MEPKPGKVDTGTTGKDPIAGRPRCGVELPDGRVCRQVVRMLGMRCQLHQARPEDLVPGPELPAGVAVPQVFRDPAWQHALVGFVAELYRDYQGLNTGADLRQILAAGATHVRLLFGTEGLDPKDIELLSRVVDRHLRNLRATPKEQEASKAGKRGEGEAGLLAAGMGVGALLERVRGVLTPGQMRALAGGRRAQGLGAPPIGQEVGLAADEAGLAEDDEDQAPDPFGD